MSQHRKCPLLKTFHVCLCYEQVPYKPTLQQHKQSVCLQLPLLLLALIVYFARQITHRNNISCKTPDFLGTTHFARLSLGQTWTTKGRLTQETIAFVPARLSPSSMSAFFAANFLRESSLVKGLRLKRISYLWVLHGFGKGFGCCHV